MPVRLAVLVLVLATCAVPRAAAAAPFRGLRLEGWYGKIGLESGVAFARERGASPTLGGAATFVHLDDHLEWYGLQGDLLVDWNGAGDAGARWSLGPELGVSLYGLDISYFGERAAGQTNHGFQVRPKLTIGLVALYLRGGFAVTGAEETSLEVGLQVKLPVFIARHRRTPRSTGLAAR